MVHPNKAAMIAFSEGSESNSISRELLEVDGVDSPSGRPSLRSMAREAASNAWT